MKPPLFLLVLGILIQKNGILSSTTQNSSAPLELEVKNHSSINTNSSTTDTTYATKCVGNCEDPEPEYVEYITEQSVSGIKHLDVHMHPHPPKANYSTYKTIMRFTYGEEDEYGPHKWDHVPSAEFTTNECRTNKFTPMNIVQSMTALAESDQSQGKTSLQFFASPGIDYGGWEFGFSEDIFNGIVVMPKFYGMLQLLDEFDSHENDDGAGSRMYDFKFALITFCDFEKVSVNRSGHQIEGKRFPFEIHMIFSAYSLEIGIDKTVLGENKDTVVMVSILGQISKTDNPNLAPMIDAAKQFIGSEYSEDIENEPIKILEPFSPLSFLPKETGYFYYMGNFPIPPCFDIQRIYVLEVPISISKNQLSVLTSLQSKREPTGVLSCTSGLIEADYSEVVVFYNPTSIRRQQNGADIQSNNIGNRLISYKIFLEVLLLTLYSNLIDYSTGT